MKRKAFRSVGVLLALCMLLSLLSVAALAAPSYSVTLLPYEHGTVSIDKTQAGPGEIVTVTAEPERGYVVERMYYTMRDGTDVMILFNGSFRMPDNDVLVTVDFAVDDYMLTVLSNINVLPCEHGSAYASKDSAVPGETVSIRAVPDEGWEVDCMYYTRRDDSDVMTFFIDSFVVPQCDVYVSVLFREAPTPPAQETYSITVLQSANGVAKADKREAAAGETVTVTAVPDQGYAVERMFYTRDDNSDTLVEFNTTFVMPACNVLVSVDFTDDIPVIPVLYHINLIQSDNGTIFCDKHEAVPGETVSIRAVPDEGFELKEIGYTKGDDSDVLTLFSGTFVMPYCDVYVKAVFREIPAGDPDAQPEPPSTVPDLPFTDLPEDEELIDAVEWAYVKGITTGVSATAFAPDGPCVREQIVTFLWRAAGKPVPGISSVPFEDVAEGSYYRDAVLWAYENGITLGVDATHFGVGEPCTREQVVTFQYRAAGKPEAGDGASFSDVPEGEFYADAVAWAAGKGITLGIGGGLFGTGETCSRGQIALFLYRGREA